MGCDIHLHVEYKIDGVWHHGQIINMDRCYPVFAKMGGVRNGGEVIPIAELRGLPGDITEFTRMCRDSWGSDGHSDNYLTADEVGELDQWVRTGLLTIWPGVEFRWGLVDLFNHSFFLGRHSWGVFSERRDDVREPIDDFRFVFWFDN